MPGESSRRDFLKGVFGEALRRAPTVPSAVLHGAGPDPGPATRSPARAPGVTRTARSGELRRLATEVGLQQHLDAITSLAMPSVRLLIDSDPPRTVGKPARGSALLGQRPEGAILRLALAQVAHEIEPFDLGVSRALLFLAHTSGEVSVVEEGDAAEGQSVAWPIAGAGGLAVRPSVELVLPRVWAEPVEALGLDSDSQLAWIELRARLAALQDADLPGEQGPAPVIHRLLGYPDERNGTMPLLCEFAHQGVDLEGESPFTHSRGAELAAGAARWRLLLQLSEDPLAGWSFGGGGKRLYLWIDAEDLAAGDLSRVVAVRQ